MKYRSLGRTGVQVSSLCLGTMNFGGRCDETEARKILETAVSNGLNFIDTANAYGHEPLDFKIGRGRSEEIIGRFLHQTGQRDRIVLATKAYFRMTEDPNGWGSSRRHIIEQCEESLKRLKTDYIDLYQLHHPHNSIPIDETLRALDDLVRAGKIRYIGTSSFAAWQLIESLWVSKEYHLNRFICEQPAYNLLDRRIERELVPMAQTYGFGIIPWSPTAAGFLTGKYKRNQPLPSDSRFATFWRGLEKRHMIDAAFDIIDQLTALSQEKECTLYQLALAWCMQQPGITSPIIGPRTNIHLLDSLKATEITLDDTDNAKIDQIAPPGRATVPYYGHDGMAWIPWGPHQNSWI